MKIVIYDGGASSTAMLMFQACCTALAEYYNVRAEPFGNDREDSGIVVTNPNDRTEEWIQGYARGFADHWNES